MKTATPEACQLLMEGSLALSAVEAAGMRIDIPYLDRTIIETGNEIRGLEETIKTGEVWRAWHRRYGGEANLGSRTQLANILFRDLGIPHPTLSKEAVRVAPRLSADEMVLEQLDMPFAKDYLEIEKLRKLKGTYLEGVRREVEGEYLHPAFWLHKVRTYRGSGSDPNFQNIPIRVPKIGKRIRQAFIPRDGHVLIEMDFSQIEVRVAACYHQDPNMLTHIRNGYDFHKEMAEKCYRLGAPPPGLDDAQKKARKAVRQQAKALFVFAEFYGDYYVKVAKSLWEAVIRYGLANDDGTDLITHMRTQGIERLGALDPKQRPQSGTFEKHIQEVEDYFWNVMYPIYTKWKKEWFAAYRRQGYFQTLTGFVCQGIMSRNDVINYPVQGSAFHCLLWALIKLVRFLDKHRMRSVVIGQIHDSLVLDCHEDEVEDVVAIGQYIMTKWLPQHWPWIIVQLEAEVDIATTNWHEKKPYTLAA